MHVTADLAFQVEVDGSGRASQPIRCTGRLHARGQDVTVEFTPAPSLGGSSTRPLVRPLARRLAEEGLTVHLVGPDGLLLRLGAGVRAPRWQWLATRSRIIELGAPAVLARSLRGPRLFEVALPPAVALPAATRRQRSRRGRVLVAARQLGRRVTGRRR